MREKPISPVLRQALELGPSLLFFAVYMWIKEDTFVIWGTSYSGFIVAAVILVPVLLASIAALWWLTGVLSRMQIFVAIMVIVFGGLTAWFNNQSFFKMKTTIVYAMFSILLWIGILRGKSYLQWIMGAALPLKPEGWMILTRRLAMMFAALAVANELIWRTQSEYTWVVLETFGMPVALFVFLMVQISLLERFIIEPPDDKS
ncbi:MAG: septation protein IspZ [Tabrizicola sp.]|nr:septation protein IspZ [Tabrizicola sp.]